MLFRCRDKFSMEILRAPGAWVSLDIRDPNSPKPPWKYYYEVRNVVYTNLYRRDSLTLAGRLKRILVRLRAQASRIYREPDRPTKIRLFVLGALHGVLGILGRRVPPGTSDRSQMG